MHAVQFVLCHAMWSMCHNFDLCTDGNYAKMMEDNMKSTIIDDEYFDQFMQFVRMNIGHYGTDGYWFYIYNSIIADGDDPIEIVSQNLFSYAMNAIAMDMGEIKTIE
jgi:hypothetical protein